MEKKMMRRLLPIMLAVALLLTATAIGTYPVRANEQPTPEPPTMTPTPGKTPTPTPTPTSTPAWDKSSLAVQGECRDGVQTFVITNGGSKMLTASSYWFVHAAASAATCNQLPYDPSLGGGTILLDAGEEMEVVFPKGSLEPPYGICVAQQPGHPGIGYAAASIGTDDICVTALDETGEPGRARWLFLPTLRH